MTPTPEADEEPLYYVALYDGLIETSAGKSERISEAFFYEKDFESELKVLRSQLRLNRARYAVLRLARESPFPPREGRP